VIAPAGPRGIGGPGAPGSAGVGAMGAAAAAWLTPMAQAERDALVERYAHLVKYVVGRLAVSIPGVFDREDAMQAGTMGLLRAIDAYKAESAASFESYAIVRIRGAIA
jgi:DNA-directed RNA polymerase specialized sigma subunit